MYERARSRLWLLANSERNVRRLSLHPAQVGYYSIFWPYEQSATQTINKCLVVPQFIHIILYLQWERKLVYLFKFLTVDES